MHLATWNVNSLKIRLPHLLRWLQEAEPDVVCLQETKCVDEAFPADEIRAAGYPHVVFSGQKTYNGVAILSKRPLEDVHAGFRAGDDDDQKRLLQATVDDIRILDCYVPNGQKVGSDKFHYKLAWLARLREELASLDPSQPIVVLGDMNIARADLDVWDAYEAEGEVMFHPLERQALEGILAWGLTDVYRALKPEGREFSWWDYRMLGFQRNHGWRIDYVLATAPVMERISEIELWRPVRKWEKPSDHIPVSVRIRS